MSETTFLRELLNQGGGWVLAGLCILVIFHLAKLWVADVREAAAREREARVSLEELHRVTLAHISSSAAGLAEMRAALIEDIGRRRAARGAAS